MEKDPGEPCVETFDFKQITWKISNALPLPDLVDYKEQSPTFSFAGATWRLELYPYGQTEEESEGYIDLMFVRLNSRFSEHNVYYKFCFITKHGKEFESYSYCSNVTQDSRASGLINYLKKSIFINRRNFLAPEGDLTIMCQLRTKKISVIDRYCQVESTASFLESSTQTSTEEIESFATTSKGCDCGLRQPAQLLVNKTLQDLKELFLKQEECDVIIKVKEKEFRAHKAILIARSPVFASTFRNDMKEKSTGTIAVEDCDPTSFSDFLCFLYCGNVEILTTENVFSLFTAADKYDVQDLRLECLEFMKKNLSVDTFCETLTLALQHFEKELIGLTTDFFTKHWEEILVTVKWQSFVVENPIQGNEIMVKTLILKKK